MDQQWPIEGEKSFLKFRWPIASDEKIYLKREDRHADFSREQYDEELKKTYPIFIKFLLRINFQTHHNFALWLRKTKSIDPLILLLSLMFILDPSVLKPKNYIST